VKVTCEWVDDLVHVIIIKKLTFAWGYSRFIKRRAKFESESYEL
jgi:hypothetical protein